MDAIRHVEALDRIEVASVRAAFIYLLIEAERAGLRTSSNSGHVFAVRLHDRDGKYVFSYIANQAHLLFYLREPALQKHAGLAAAANASNFDVSANPAGEITTRIESVEQAVAFFEWLKAQLHF